MTLPAKFVTFFGRYLLEHGIVEESILEEALMVQGRECTLLGDLAVVRGYMQDDGVMRVFEAQKHSDKPFGELAVEFGLLTEDQLEDLLFIQNVHTSHLGEVLLSKGAITESQFEAALEAFLAEEKQGREAAETVFRQHTQSGVLRAFIHALEVAFSRFMKERVKVQAICEDSRMNEFDVEFRFDIQYADQPDTVCIVFLGVEFARVIAERLSGETQDACGDSCLAECRGFMEVVGRYLIADMERAGASPSGFTLKASEMKKVDFETKSTLAVEMITPCGPMSLAVVVE